MWWKVLAAIGALAVIAALALPVTTMTIKVDLPPATPPAPACKSIELRMAETPEGVRLSLNGAPTSRDKLLLDMAKAHDCSAAETPVVIRRDSEIKYGEFVAVVDQLQGSGYAKVSLVTEHRNPQTKASGG